MKALTKIMTIALVLDFTLIDVAAARPRAPGSGFGAVFIWCDQNHGAFFSGTFCYGCEFERSDGSGRSDVYECCVTENESVACAWKLCVPVNGGAGGRTCGVAKPDALANILLETLRSQSQTKVPAQPDLVPLPTPASMPPEGFCRRNDQGQLLVKIYNQGGTDAAATKTRVQFGSAAPTDFDTPAIPAGKGTELVISIPNACFDANNKCAFTIGADATDTTAESNETNNNAAGLCGPQLF